MVGQTWNLAGRCWRTLDRLMDIEGMKPGSREYGSMLGKRKRRDTGSFTVEEQQQKRENLVSAATALASHDPSNAPQFSPHSSNDTPYQDAFSSWPPSLSIAATTVTSSLVPPMNIISSDIFFDPDFFSSNTGWMPEVHMASSFDNIWDTSDGVENFWTRNS